MDKRYIKPLVSDEEIPPMLTPMELSVITASTDLKGIRHFTENSMRGLLVASGNIFKISCSKWVTTNPDYKMVKKIRVSKRGRKKSDPKIKKAKRGLKPSAIRGQGRARRIIEEEKSSPVILGIRLNEDPSFHSQITFETRGSHVRAVKKTLVLDDDLKDKEEIIITPISGRPGYELVTKIYKIKVFFTGNVQIPGSLCDDMSDVIIPLREVIATIERAQGLPENTITFDKITSVMRNYKFRMIRGQIRLENIRDVICKSIEGHISTNFKSVVDYCINLGDDGINSTTLAHTLSATMYKHTLLVKLDYLVGELKMIEVEKTNERLAEMRAVLEKRHKVKFSDSFMSLVKKFVIIKLLAPLKLKLKESKTNKCVDVDFDDGRYHGVKIKISTPIPVPPLKPGEFEKSSLRNKREKKKNKATSVKVFRVRVNIDGANTYEEAARIYEWLNSVIYTHREQVVYVEDLTSDEDSEFSISSEEDPEHD